MLSSELYVLVTRQTPVLTKGTFDGTAGGGVDLAAVILDLLGELYQGGVTGEAALGGGG